MVVEGYTDVMACHLAGITTAIATCGTAFGSDHITVLRRVMGDDSSGGEVVFTFDPDAAGQKAALRAFADEKRFSAQTYVAVAPDGLDPCDLRLARGDDAVRALMTTKAPMFEFVIDQRLSQYDLGTVEGRAAALRAAAPVVADIRDPSLRPGYVRVLARRIGLDLDEVSAAVSRASRSRDTGGSPQRRGRDDAAPAERQHPDDGAAVSAPVLIPTIASLPRTRDVVIERDALMAALQFGHRLDDATVRRALGAAFQHPALDAVRAAVVEAPDYTRAGWAVQAVDTIREPYRALGSELLMSAFPALGEADAAASASDLMRRLIVRRVDSEKAELVRAVQRVPPDSEEGRRIRLQLRELDLERQRWTGDTER